MKDKLVFVKTETDNASKCISDCEGCAIQDCENYVKVNCVKGYHYKLSEEEPVKIQTNPISKYEWYKDRLEIINDYMGELQCNNADPTEADKQLFKEVDWLKDYIKDNKPTNFVPCTRENTKVGDDVKGKASGEMYSVEYIFPYRDAMILAQHKKNHDYGGCGFVHYGIDLNNTEE